jgi:hypothetical protein
MTPGTLANQTNPLGDGGMTYTTVERAERFLWIVPAALLGASVGAARFDLRLGVYFGIMVLGWTQLTGP